MPMSDAQVVQIGKESTWGTAVTPTIKVAGVSDASINPTVDTRVIATSRGGFAPGSAAAITNILAGASLKQEALYEDMAYWLENMFGTATPSGAGPYTRTYTAPAASAPTPIPWTFVYGDPSLGAYKMPGALITSFTLSGKVGDTVQLALEFSGVNASATTTAALSDRTVYPLMMHHLGGVYVDTWAGTVGTTTMPYTLYGFELKVETPRPTRRYAGSTVATTYNQRKWSGTLRLDMDYNASSKNLYDLVTAATAPVQRQIRLKFSDTANRDLQIDFAGTVVEAPKAFDDDDGVVTLPMTFQGTYNSTLATWLKMVLINSIATV